MQQEVRVRKEIGKRGKPLKEGMPALADCAKATDEAYQCAKNDGRGWRCPKVVMDGKTLCQYHWYRLKNRRELIAEEKVSRRAATRG